MELSVNLSQDSLNLYVYPVTLYQLQIYVSVNVLTFVCYLQSYMLLLNEYLDLEVMTVT